MEQLTDSSLITRHQCTRSTFGFSSVRPGGSGSHLICQETTSIRIHRAEQGSSLFHRMAVRKGTISGEPVVSDLELCPPRFTISPSAFIGPQESP